MTGAKRPQGVPLGINANIASPPPEDRAVLARLLRWQRQNGARELCKGERVEKCLWVRVSSMVEIWKTQGDIKRAHYRGLHTCGSVWMCPVCSAKITERRRMELQETIDAARDQGIIVFMVTLTLQHNKREKYKTVVDALRDAWRKVRSGAAWQRMKSKYKIFGLVTALEFTVSLDNGGHPHLHVLIFSKLAAHEINADVLKYDISKRYDEILQKNSRYASPVHGVIVQLGDQHVGDYVAKIGRDEKKDNWGLAAEMTKGMNKSGGLKQGEHYTPFQLIDLFLAGDKQAAAMFQQFAQAFKGKHQIGGLSQLRKKLGLSNSMSDEEIAEANDQAARRFVRLMDEQWYKIRRAGQRGQALEVASQGDYQTFKRYAAGLGITLDD